jgi:hypothetical protein
VALYIYLHLDPHQSSQRCFSITSVDPAKLPRHHEARQMTLSFRSCRWIYQSAHWGSECCEYNSIYIYGEGIKVDFKFNSEASQCWMLALNNELAQIQATAKLVLSVFGHLKYPVSRRSDSSHWIISLCLRTVMMSCSCSDVSAVNRVDSTTAAAMVSV